jgi:hypothetical protein
VGAGPVGLTGGVVAPSGDFGAVPSGGLGAVPSGVGGGPSGDFGCARDSARASMRKRGVKVAARLASLKRGYCSGLYLLIASSAFSAHSVVTFRRRDSLTVRSKRSMAMFSYFRPSSSMMLT